MGRIFLATFATAAVALLLGAPAALGRPAHGLNCPYGVNAGDICESFTSYDPNANGGQPGVPGVGGGNWTIHPNTRTGAYIVSQEFPKYGSSDFRQYATSSTYGVGSDQSWKSAHPQPFALACVDVHCAYDTSVPLQDPTDPLGTAPPSPGASPTNTPVSGLPLMYPPVIVSKQVISGCAETQVPSATAPGIITCSNPQDGGPLDISHWEFGVNPHTQTGNDYPYGVGNPAHDPTKGCFQLAISSRTTVPVYVHDNDFEYGPGCTMAGQGHAQSLNGTGTLTIDSWRYGYISVGSKVIVALDQNGLLGVVANTASTLNGLPGCDGQPCTGTGVSPGVVGTYQFAPSPGSCSPCQVNGNPGFTFSGSWDGNGVLTVTAGSVSGGTLAAGDFFNCPATAGRAAPKCYIVFDNTSAGAPCNSSACTGPLADSSGTYSISIHLNLTNDPNGPSAPAQPVLIEPCSTCGGSGSFGEAGGTHSIWFYNNMVNGHSEDGDTMCNGWPCEAGGTSFANTSGIRVIAYNAFLNQGERPINGDNIGSADVMTLWKSSVHYIANYFGGMGMRPFGVHAEIDELAPYNTTTANATLNGTTTMVVNSVSTGYLCQGATVTSGNPGDIPSNTRIVAPAGCGTTGSYTLSAAATASNTETVTAPGGLGGVNEYLYNVCMVPNMTYMSGMTSCVYATTGQTNRFVWSNFDIEGNTFIANTRRAGCPTGYNAADGWTCNIGAPIISRLVAIGDNIYINATFKKNYLDDNYGGPYAASDLTHPTGNSLNGGACFMNESNAGTFVNTPYWGSDAANDANVSLITGVHIVATPSDGYGGFGSGGYGPACH